MFQAPADKEVLGHTLAVFRPIFIAFERQQKPPDDGLLQPARTMRRRRDAQQQVDEARLGELNRHAGLEPMARPTKLSLRVASCVSPPQA